METGALAVLHCTPTPTPTPTPMPTPTRPPRLSHPPCTCAVVDKAPILQLCAARRHPARGKKLLPHALAGLGRGDVVEPGRALAVAQRAEPMPLRDLCSAHYSALIAGRCVICGGLDPANGPTPPPPDCKGEVMRRRRGRRSSNSYSYNKTNSCYLLYILYMDV